MELQEMRTAVKNRAGMDVNDAMVVDDVLDQFINASLRQVTMMQDWDWNWHDEIITTIAGVKKYDRSYDARKTDMVVDTDTGRPLRQVTKAQGHRYAAYSRTGRPRYWYVQGGELVLSPTPDKAYEIEHIYVAEETRLVDAEDEPHVPDWAIDVILVKAAIMVATRMDDTSLLQLLEREEKDLLDSLDDEARRSRGSMSISSRRDWSL